MSVISQKMRFGGSGRGNQKAVIAAATAGLAAIGITLGVVLSGGDGSPNATEGAPLAPADVSAGQTVPADGVQLEPGDSLAPADGEPGVVLGEAPDSGVTGLSVDELLGGGFDRPMVVSGYLFVQDGGVRLCELLAESFPPQCAGANVEVSGLSANQFLLETEQGVAWSSTHVQVMGQLENGVLVATPIS